MQKMVDGVLIDMTADEIAARRAEEAQEELDIPKRKARAEMVDIEAQLREIDIKSMRAIRLKDDARITEWESAADVLRQRWRELNLLSKGENNHAE